ncbi:hypothetical protein GCM10027413_21490 [Conyzicola nivalis]|uniref:Uncharacterized protein n=1 Tax=Conyzicola nivalis TaxID=1477021 RepID=A0A916SCP9_9MICO|nr:hypothetical protein GCM10010979_05130 [Conyzicola nivalis]
MQQAKATDDGLHFSRDDPHCCVQIAILPIGAEIQLIDTSQVRWKAHGRIARDDQEYAFGSNRPQENTQLENNVVPRRLSHRVARFDKVVRREY